MAAEPQRERNVALQCYLPAGFRAAAHRIFSIYSRPAANCKINSTQTYAIVVILFSTLRVCTLGVLKEL